MITGSIWRLATNIGDRNKNCAKPFASSRETAMHIVKILQHLRNRARGLSRTGLVPERRSRRRKPICPAAISSLLSATSNRAMGSKKPFAKGPRLIDLDILLYGNETIATPDLQVPHPRMLERNLRPRPTRRNRPNSPPPSWPRTAAELLRNPHDQRSPQIRSPCGSS